LVQDHGGAEFKTGGILLYVEDFKRGTNKDIGPKDIFDMGSICISAGFALADSQPPAVGGKLPEFTLSVPKNDEHQEYLGLAGKESFKISEISAEVVIIEIFSMY
jgi:hypothetical protein